MEKRAIRTVKKIAVVGAECTGKTSLCQGLAASFSTQWVPEALREFVDKTMKLPQIDDMLRIAQTQVAWERELAQKANQFLFCDTNPLVLQVLCEHYFKKVPQPLEQLAQKSIYSLYVLAKPDFPWQSDGRQRDGVSVQQAIQRKIEEKLKTRQLNWVPASGSLPDRVRSICEKLSFDAMSHTQ